MAGSSPETRHVFFTARTVLPLAILGILLTGVSGRENGRARAADAPMLFEVGSACSRCHDRLHDLRGEDVSIHSDWRATMMANAGRDPLWQAKVASEVLRTPTLRKEIEERCTRCHMPMARYQALAEGAVPAIGGDGFAHPGNPYHQLAMDGVSCTLCHQLLPWGDEPPHSGLYRIDAARTSPWREVFGPSFDPFAMPMQRMSGFTPVHGAQMREPGLCAQCHTLFVPVVDAAGNVHPDAPEQTPYLEWRESSFARKDGPGFRSCQDCHLPENGAPARIASMPHRLGARAPVGLHYLVGGNSFMLSMLRENAAETGVTAPAGDLDLAMERTRVMLQKYTARLSLENPAVREGRLEIAVRVENLAGHKFPTGFPVRRAWIHLTVSDVSGQGIFESGRPLPDGSIDGNDADLDLLRWEPHYETITGPGQVQIYEAVMGDSDGRVTYTLLRAKEHIKDNRLLPAGSNRSALPDEVRVHGEAGRDPDFSSGSDRVRYVVSPGAAAGPFRVKAELLYQTVGYAFVRDLLELRGKSPQIERFARLYAKADKRPTVVAVAEAVIGPLGR